MKEILFSALPERERVQRFLPKYSPEVRKIIATKMMVGLNAELDQLLQSPQELDEEFEVVEQITTATGSAINTSDLCLNYINASFLDATQQQTLQSLRERNFPSFAFWFDITFGMAALNIIGTAKGYQTGELKKIAAETISKTGKDFSRDIKNDFHKYLIAMQEGKEAAALLEADPTGLLLVERHIDRLKKQPLLIIGSDSIMPEYVIAGAEFAQKAYQGIYPLAEKFLSQTK